MTNKTNSEHWVTEPKFAFGEVVAFGVSSWDVRDGDRLRREMTRSTPFNSVKAMLRWAKKYGLNVDRQIVLWQKLVTPEA